MSELIETDGKNFIEIGKKKFQFKTICINFMDRLSDDKLKHFIDNELAKNPLVACRKANSKQWKGFCSAVFIKKGWWKFSLGFFFPKGLIAHEMDVDDLCSVVQSFFGYFEAKQLALKKRLKSSEDSNPNSST